MSIRGKAGRPVEEGGVSFVRMCAGGRNRMKLAATKKPAQPTCGEKQIKITLAKKHDACKRAISDTACSLAKE